MATTDTVPPMPDLDCPSWCERDHEADWRMHVSVARDTRGVPMADGTVLHGRTSEAEWLAMFEPFHTHTTARVDLSHGNERAQVDLQRGPEQVTRLYVDAEGDMTAEQARAFAAGLLKAADVLEQVTRPVSPVVLDDRGQVAALGDYRPLNQ